MDIGMDEEAVKTRRFKLSFTSVVGLILLVILGLSVFGLFKAREYGDVAVGYAARQMCSCLFVQGRGEAECLADLGEARDAVKLVYFNEKVVANFNGLVQAQATMKPGYGCAVTDFVGSMPHAGP
jgi:hypothetical protein